MIAVLTICRLPLLSITNTEEVCAHDVGRKEMTGVSSAMQV